MKSAYKFQWSCFLLLSALLLVGITARGGYCASFDAFLEIEGIEGESEYKPGAIEILSYSWGMSNSSASSSGGGMGSGKVSIQDFHFVKRCDKSSPLLIDRCCSGTHFPSVVLTLVHTPDPPADGTPGYSQYMRYTLEDCLISSFSIGGSSSGEPVPAEELSLNFTKITFEYMRTGSNPAEASSACVGSATR